MEGKPVCARCLKTHYVGEACKAEDLAKLVALVTRNLAENAAGQPDGGVLVDGVVYNHVDDVPVAGIFSESAAAEKADEELEGTLSVKPGFDRAAYMRERHAKRKRDGEEG